MRPSKSFLPTARHRRLIPLRLACLLAFLTAGLSASAGESPAKGDGKTAAFSFADVEARAAELAATAYAPPDARLPDFLLALSYREWRNIRYRLGKDALWGGNAETGILPRFLPPGFFLNQIAAVNLVDGAAAAPLPFSPDLLDGPDKNLVDRMRQAKLGFAGFQIDVADNKGGAESPGLVGTSHFQFAGRNARFGPFARPLALDTALSSGEQFCSFREFWLRKPDGDAFVFYALMDAPGMTGAFEFAVAPGTSTVVDVAATLYARRGAAAPAKIGLAPIAGMFLFSESTGRPPDDYRPEVHNCDGLLVASGESWQWTPLKNPRRLLIGSVALNNPRGFGLLQRDAGFDHYQDPDNRYDLASSLWVEPKGDWGAGEIELVEIPDSKEYHANIIAYWVPGPKEASPDGAAGATGGAPASAFTLQYRLYWMPPGTKLHDLGVVRDTRIARSDEDGSIAVVIDFEGEALNALPADTGLTSVVEVPKEVGLLEKRLMKNGATGGWRLTLKLAPPRGGVLDSLWAAREGPAQFAIAAHLKRGENLPEVLTETWRYNLTP